MEIPYSHGYLVYGFYLDGIIGDVNHHVFVVCKEKLSQNLVSQGGVVLLM